MTGPVDVIGELFAGEGAQDYLGEEVSVAVHMRQAGTLAEAAGAAATQVAAALLHDVGHICGATVSGRELMAGTESMMCSASAKITPSSPKLCSWGPPSTMRRAPRREAITPSARSAAKACRTVPRDTEYRSARSLSDGSRVPAGYSPVMIAARRSSATLR